MESPACITEDIGSRQQGTNRVFKSKGFNARTPHCDATFALWMMFLLGKHAMFGHDPPMYLRSTNCDALAFASKSPRSDGRSRPTPENHQIKIFRLRLPKCLGG
jgi:hypothetical protein